MTTSILDNDLYKFTTSYAYMKMFPQATGTFKFYDRNHTKYTKEEVAKIIQRVWHLQNLALTDEEANFMKNACYFIPTYYFDWLKSFRFNPKQLNITYNEETKELGIEATGLLYEVTLWEVPILAIISEVQTLEQGPIDTLYTIRKTVEKATIAERNNLKFSEFGTRRRASFSVQDLVVETLAKNCPTSLTGTSNCFFAMKYHLTPIGTHPHEWFMFHGAMYGYEHANYMALENWINVYDGDSCGYVDYDETVQVAAARELFEECGLKTGNTTYYDLSINYAGFNDNPREDKLQNITFRFNGLIGYHFKPDLSNINSERDECADLAWISLKDIGKYEWAFEHDKLIFEMFRKL